MPQAIPPHTALAAPTEDSFAHKTPEAHSVRESFRESPRPLRAIFLTRMTTNYSQIIINNPCCDERKYSWQFVAHLRQFMLKEKHVYIQVNNYVVFAYHRIDYFVNR